MNVIFFIETKLNVFWPRIFRPKNVVNEGLSIKVVNVNEEPSLVVVNEGLFMKTIVSLKRGLIENKFEIKYFHPLFIEWMM